MDIEERLGLVREVGEEIVTEEDLRHLLETKRQPIAYDGFEPSGNVHIAQGILRTININKMLKAGFKFKMWVADWHAWANDKMGGDLDKIQKVGKYLIEVWKASGMDLDKVEFLWVSDFIEDEDYWKIVMDVARHNTVKRIIRCSQIMGRSESESLSAAQILYPCMQCADIFYLKADVTQLGMDQRKVNMLAREVGPKLGFWKPVVVSHHMLMGLGEPPKAGSAAEKAMAMKMSKSDPNNAIFMTDSEDEIRKKLSKAYCPAKQVQYNPVLEYAKYLVFEKFDAMDIRRPEKFGGDLSINSYEELEKSFATGSIHPMDLKNSVASYINEMVTPVREHFEKNKKAKKMLDEVKSFS